MAQLVPEASFPLGRAAIQGQARKVGRIAWGTTLVVGGIGLAIMLLPWIVKIPFIGPVFSAGAGIIPQRRANGMSSDRFGPSRV